MTLQPPVKIFVSYAHNDSYWCAKFYEHLSGLRRDGIIDVWYDAYLLKRLEKDDEAWTEWQRGIDEELQKATVFVFLLSSSFGASKFCQYEWKVAKQRMDLGERVKLLPVNLKAWEPSHEFRILQIVPSNPPIHARRKPDDAFAETAKVIRGIVNRILGRGSDADGDVDETDP